MTDQEALEFLKQLVRHRSDSRDHGAQRELQTRIVDRLKTTIQRLRIRQGSAEDYPWTLITTGPSADPMLLFACHMDTVPVGDPGGWAHPPFSGHIDGVRIYGRGTVDMKGGIAAAAAALTLASDLNKHVGLLLTADEEVGSLGAPDAAGSLIGQRIGAVIIPEATDNKIVLGHRGALWLRVRSDGLAAHGSTPDLGINAALKISAVLLRAQHELPLTGDSFLGAESWNPGILAAGSAANIVPDSAEAVIDMRVVGDSSALLNWWIAQPEIASVETVLSLVPLRTTDTAPLSTGDAEINRNPAPYFTDGSALAQALPGVPIVIWGPGTSDQMHARDESLELQSLFMAVRHFRGAVAAWN
jgi:succinyl-diaminopimelate desuccinylase